MQTETITLAEAEAEIAKKSRGNCDTMKEWQDLKERMGQEDELVKYIDIDGEVMGFCTGDAGIALLSNGEVIAKVVLAIIC